MQYDMLLNVFNSIPYPTHEFPDDERLYRIAWFGQLGLNPLALSEPTIELVLIPYLEPRLNRATINRKAAYDYLSARIVHVGVGQLSALPIGGFIRNKCLIAVPDYRIETYELIIDNAHTDIIRADATYRDHGTDVPYIPHDYYPLPKYVGSTRCMIVECPVASENDVTSVIFPCVELIRAYFAPSSVLVKEVVKGGITDSNNIFDPERTGFWEDGTAFLQLRSRMHDEDAGDIARFALVPAICDEVRYIHDSIVLNGNNGEGYVAVARPPFRGPTRMILHGKRIKSGKSWHFLVFRIADCTGSYPFERLRYARDNDGRGDGTNDHNRPEAYKDTNWVGQSSKLLDQAEIYNDDEPSLDQVKIEIRLPTGQFSSMPKDIDKIKKIRSNHRAAENSNLNATREITGFSTADGDYGDTPLNRLEIFREITDLKSCDRLSTFREVLALIQQKANPTLQYTEIILPLFVAGVKNNSGFSLFPGRFVIDKLEVTLPWSIFPGPPKRRRRVIIAELVFHDHWFYLFEAERKPPVGMVEESIATLVVCNPDGAKIDDADLLTRILLHGARQRGVWMSEWPWPDLVVTKLNHQSVTVDRFAERLLQCLRKVIPTVEGEPSVAVDSADLSRVA